MAEQQAPSVPVDAAYRAALGRALRVTQALIMAEAQVEVESARAQRAEDECARLRVELEQAREHPEQEGGESDGAYD